MKIILFILGIILLYFMVLGVYILRDFVAFNHGICKKCEYPLHNFGVNYKGSRGYACRKCGYSIWINYGFIDGR